MTIEPSGKSDAALIGSHRGSGLTVDGFQSISQSRMGRLPGGKF